MLKKHKRVLDLLFRLFDTFFIVLSSILAYSSRFDLLPWVEFNVDIQFLVFVIILFSYLTQFIVKSNLSYFYHLIVKNLS